MNFMRYRMVFFSISLLFIIPGCLSLLFFGLKPSLDFTGGFLLEFQLTDASKGSDQLQALQDKLNNEYDFSVVQATGEKQLLIKGQEMDNQQKEVLLQTMQTEYGALEVLRFETVGPSLGAELLQKTVVAVALVAVVITLYVWKQFKELRYGLCAILAMLHDSLIVLGAFSVLGVWFGIEVDALFVTALLTTMSFSIHDTIVVYDRLRELKRKHQNASSSDLANAAIAETLSRSINNSLTIIIMLLGLVMLGGESIHVFALALLIGAVTGTYSSTFTAVPLLTLFERKK